MIGGHLDQNDADAVRVLDPQLGQSPWLGHGLAQNPDTRPGQPLVLGVHVPHLEPDHHRVPGGIRGRTRHFQQSLAEKEHHRRFFR